MAEEPRLVRQCVGRHVLHRAEAERAEPRRAIAREVELPPVLAPAFGEEARVLGVPRQHGIPQVRPDLVARLGDAGADRGDHPRAGGAEPLHRRDRRFQHARSSSSPAGMGGADHAGLRVGEEHRRAIPGDDAERDAGPARHHRVRRRPRALVPTGRIHLRDRGAMHLRKPMEGAGGQAERVRRAAPVLPHAIPVVLAGERAVERSIRPLRHAAAPGEEAMAEARRPGEGRGRQMLGGAVVVVAAHAASKPGGGGSAGSHRASALNSRPIRSGATNRSAPERIRPACAPFPAICAARARIAARLTRPRRCRNSPCGSGPWVAAP